MLSLNLLPHYQAVMESIPPRLQPRQGWYEEMWEGL